MAADFVKIEVEVEPDVTKISFAMEKWAQAIKDWGPIWKDVIKLFKSHEKKHLNSEGTTTGPRFTRLADWYSDWKEEFYPSLPILQRNRVLYAALVEGGSGSLQKQTKTSLTVGVDEGSRVGIYALAHQKGLGPAYSRGQAARPPIRVNPDIENRQAFGYAVAQIAQSHVVKKRKESFTGEVKNEIRDSKVRESHTSTIASILKKTWQ